MSVLRAPRRNGMPISQFFIVLYLLEQGCQKCQVPTAQGLHVASFFLLNNPKPENVLLAILYIKQRKKANVDMSATNELVSFLRDNYPIVKMFSV